MEDVFEDAQPLKRVEVKRQEWKHLQVDTSEKGLIDNPWENEALHDLEETLSPTRAEELKGVAHRGVGSDGFHPKVQTRVGKLWSYRQ